MSRCSRWRPRTARRRVTTTAAEAAASLIAIGVAVLLGIAFGVFRYIRGGGSGGGGGGGRGRGSEPLEVEE